VTHEAIVTDEHTDAVAGAIATDVTRELAEPLRTLRDRLALMVDAIDRHVSLATGPTPYPWKALALLRQDLADAYLESRELARMVGDFVEGLRTVGSPSAAVDIGKAVEAAVNLASHRVAPRTELLVDLGSVPKVHASPGEVLLVVAQLVLVCAESAAVIDGSAMSVTTRLEAPDGRLPMVLVLVADNGGGAAESAARVAAHVGPWASRHGGSFEGAWTGGHGTTFELRLPVTRDE
jgi:signal transduction histidine kinase